MLYRGGMNAVLRRNIISHCSSPPVIARRNPYLAINTGACRSYVAASSSGGTGNGDPARPIHRNNRDPYRQHSLADNTLKQKLRSGHPTVGVVTGFHNDTDHVETLGLLGYDFLWADAEHSAANPSSISNLIMAAERRGMPTLVRIGYGYQNIIGHSQKFLVAGAQGIILPQCECADDAAKIVEAVKFPPLGRRGLAGERWNAWGLGEGGTLGDRVREANKNSIVGVVVESRKGIEALDSILSVEEIDFVFVAPTDLSSDMGLTGQIRHPDVVDMVDQAGHTIRAAGVASGMLALTGDDYVFWRGKGFQVMCGVAHTFFTVGAQSLMRTVVEHELSGIDRLKKAALNIIASKLSDEEVSGLRSVFESIDLDQNGAVDVDELHVALGDDSLDKDVREKIESIHKFLIHSGVRSLDWKDFLTRTMDEDLLLSGQNISRALGELKKAGVGNVSIADLTNIFEAEDALGKGNKRV